MKCITCKTEMICENDVNDINVRIDWLKCPKCNSIAEIVYSGSELDIIEKVTWNR